MDSVRQFDVAVVGGINGNLGKVRAVAGRDGKVMRGLYGRVAARAISGESS